MKSLLRLPIVIKRTGLPRTTVYELIKDSDFPKPIRLTMRSVAWNSEDIDSWIESRINSSRLKERKFSKKNLN